MILTFFTSSGIEWSTGSNKASLQRTTAFSFSLSDEKVVRIHSGRKRACAFSVEAEM